MSFPRYDSYRDSGVDWPGQVPAHWEVVPVKRDFSILGGATPKSDDPRFWDGGIPWYTPADLGKESTWRLGASLRTISEAGVAGSSASIVPAGSVILATRAPIGTVGITEFPAAINQGCKALIPRGAVSSPWLAYVLSVSTSRLNILGRGTTFLELSADSLGAFRMAVPPPDEQAAIAAFLDRETGKIDALIGEQARLMVLLREKRQAVIAHAVTKGLDPTAPTKPSGLDWLGNIPAHWEVVRLGTMFRFVKRQLGEDRPVLSVYREFGVVPKDERTDNHNKTPEDTSKWQTVRVGDLVINKMKAWQGSLGVSAHDGITSPDYAVFEPAVPVHLAFMNELLRCRLLPDVYRTLSNGIREGQWRIEPEKLQGLRLPLPPLNEQKKISVFVRSADIESRQLAYETEQLITLLKERRAALITAAVTGQIDVRQVMSDQTETRPVLSMIQGGRAEEAPATSAASSVPVSRVRFLVAARIVERLGHRPSFGRTTLHKHLYLAQTHLGVDGLDATFAREAAGPLDRALQTEVERALSDTGFATVHQQGRGEPVTYSPQPGRPDIRQDLIAAIGADKARALDAQISRMDTFSTQSIEAVATLYAVWNDALIAGEPTDDESLFQAVESNWHKHKNLPRHVLVEMLGWMQRNTFVPKGTGRPTVSTRQGSLF